MTNLPIQLTYGMTNKKLTAILLDDGTLDTVIGVNGKEYRFNYNSEESESYEDFVNWALEDAVNQYEEELTS